MDKWARWASPWGCKELDTTYRLTRHARTLSAKVKQGTLHMCSHMSVFFTVCLTVTHFKIFFVFVVGVSLLKWSPSVVLKCCLVFLNTRRRRCALQRKYVCQISFIWARVNSAIGSEFNEMNKPYTQSKMTLNRNAYKATLCMDWLIKIQ